MFRCTKSNLSVVLAASCVVTASLLGVATFAKPPKSQSGTNRTVRDDLGFSYVTPSEFREEQVEYKGIKPSLVLEGPKTNQETTVVSTAHYTLNTYVGTAISLIMFPRGTTPDFDQIAPTVAAKGLLNLLNSSGVGGFNYQNSALIDVSNHPALAVLAESSIVGLNDRRMVRFVMLNHRDKSYLFFFESNDTEFEDKVPAFDAFLRSLKFTQPNVAPPTPNPKKPIDIKIGQ